MSCPRPKKSLGFASGIIAAGLLVLSFYLPASALGGKVKISRKYRPGQSLVYQAKMQTHATVQSTPPGLKNFLPPLPTELSTEQRNTVTVRAVHPDGSADVETRFDQFDFKSNLSEQLAEGVRDSILEEQREFSRKVAGQTLTAHYDREGRLLAFEGGDEILQQLDMPLREPLRQILKFFLEQMGGNALYPDGQVKPGEEWKRQLTSPANHQYPFGVEGQSKLRYVGKTKYRGIKAAMVDFQFTSLLKPDLANLRQLGPLAQLESLGLGLELGITGQGQGRVLLALDDGRVLENRSTLHQTLKARLNSARPTPARDPEPLSLQIDADTTLNVDGIRP